ncbi:TonB-dependent receptor [uncultured Bacteroides sp.]|uniref:SusC/RagA family TonB-linked outer membrane protein n=1 Tax=uncultured Bacteroides sp. TaxID=162156 RepID=UPI0025E83696|nr:TonB-dependent receptor [uncultured Bacteroides sp.]
MKQVNLGISRTILTLIVGLFLSVGVYAQNITVKGHVKDALGGVIGANVVEKGNSSNGTITNADGNFTLSVSKGATLVISFIGYKTQEVAAAPSVVVNMEDDSQLLDAVVVIGYGSVKKSDLSGSVVAIEAEELNRGAVTSPQELIQGKVPGLAITSGDGGPGAGSTIRIRSGASLNASNDPLIVIDGIPTSNDAAPGTSNALSTINPNDIETFTVLKDASATAIYGSRASNGVIIITTKKGSQGKVKVTYSSTYTVKDPYNRLDVMSGDEFRNAILGQYAEGTAEGKAVRDILNQFPEQSTDWQDAIYQAGLSTDQNLAVAGKAGFLPFRVSFGYNNERGTLKTSKYERYTGAVNLSPKFFDNHLSVDVNVKGTINNNRFADSGAVGAAAYYDPTKPIYTDTEYGYNGYYNWTSIVEGAASPNTLASVNPLSLLYNVDNSGTTKRSLGNIQLDYKIHGFEDLRANLNLGYDVAKTTGDNYVVPGSFQAAKDGDFKNIGQGSSWSNLRRNHVLDFYLNYVKDIEAIRSHIDVMAGYSWQHFYYNNFSQGKSNPIEKLAVDKEGWTYDDNEGRYLRDDSTPAPYENYLVSFFGRLNYNLMDRYLLTATLRRDGSSRFSKNHRWGMFPSVALAWSLINENFMESTREVLSNLKLRVGYGITGQQEIGDYMYLTKYVFSNNTNTQYLGSFLLKPDGYSPDLKWEETTTYNVGIDYGFLNNRINGSIEYYQKHTKDLLNTVSAPAGTNFTNQITANVGTMKNEGLEFNINAVAIRTKDFSWELGYNVTWNKSEITKLTVNYNPEYEGIAAANAPFGTGVVLSRHQVGATPYNFWLFQQVYDENGNAIQGALVDRNKDGQITDADRYFTNKNPLADCYMGLSSQFTYKNWDLGFNLRASIGNYAFNASNADNGTLNNFGNQGSLSNYNKAAIEYTNGFKLTNAVEHKCSDMYLENASYMKMDNITFGYTFKKFFTDKISGRISASVQNVFTVTKYSGLDPEIPGVNGIDNNIWPRPRTYTLGLNLNF